jgi:hypothetical protein
MNAETRTTERNYEGSGLMSRIKTLPAAACFFIAFVEFMGKAPGRSGKFQCFPGQGFM